MIDAVTGERATAGESAGVGKLNGPTAGAAAWPHDGSIEVDEVGMVGPAAGYAMGGMAGAARGSAVDDVDAVVGKTLVAEDAGSVVALITQFVSGRTFGRKVGGLVIAG